MGKTRQFLCVVSLCEYGAYGYSYLWFSYIINFVRTDFFFIFINLILVELDQHQHFVNFC